MEESQREIELIDSAMRQACAVRPPLHPPDWIPGLQIKRQIHRGGQADVYEAHQISTGRSVVVKVFSSTISGDPSARFHREVQVLGRLRHPNIVAIHDSGIVDGRSYVVMDLIRGVPLSAWARDVCRSDSGQPGAARVGHRAEKERIVRLFVKLCEAVNEAHLHGVIHRDLKPGNVLVDDQDRPYVLDFGLAKLTDAEPSERSLTLDGQFVGSLAWASPEQAALKPALVDVRTDVYSIGVLLYTAMTDRFPYDVDSGLDRVLADILQAEPLPPRCLNPRVDAELETIMLKCLAKEPERRYQNAGEIGRDLRRYLDGEAIDAKRDSTWYVVRKNIRRYRGPVMVSAMFILLVFASAVVSTSLYFRARDQQRLAKAAEATAKYRAAQVERIAKFQASQLAEIDPVKMGLDLRRSLVREVRQTTDRSAGASGRLEVRMATLDRFLVGVNFTNLALDSLKSNMFEGALEAIDADFADQPLVQARLLQTVADTLRDIGLLDMATDPQERALVIRRAQLGADDPETLHSVNRLGHLLLKQGRLAGAEAYLAEAMQGYRRTLGVDHPDTLMAINAMGYVLHTKGEFHEAEAYYREASEGCRRVLSDDHPDKCVPVNNLGRLLVELGRLDDAEPYCREAVVWARRTLGEEHPFTLAAMSNLGYLLLQQGKFTEAEAYCRDTLEATRRVLGDDHPSTLMSIGAVGAVLLKMGKYEEAEPYCREALDARRRLLGDEHQDTLKSVNNLAHVLNQLGKHTDAIVLLTNSMPAARRVAAGPRLGMLLGKLGEARTGVGDYAGAEAALLEAYSLVVSGFGEKHPATIQCVRRLVALYGAWHEESPHGDYDVKAAEWRARLGD